MIKVSRAFSLMEVLIAAVIMLAFMTILAIAIVQTRSVFEATDIIIGLQENARLAITKMSNDLRRTSLVQVSITQNIPSSGTDRIVYFLPQDADGDDVPDYNINGTQWDINSIAISLDPLGTGKLFKSAGGTVSILAHNVKSVRFRDHSTDSSLYLDELQIVLEMEQTSYEGRVYNFTSTSVVNMRN